MEQDKQARTPVILVCVYNKRGVTLTHDIYYRQFKEYGTIRRILIFEKAKVWKTFIEFDEVHQAREALSSCDGQPLLEDGSRMSIFSSKLKTVNITREQSGGVDYTTLQAKSGKAKSPPPPRGSQHRRREEQFLSTTLGLLDQQFRELASGSVSSSSSSNSVLSEDSDGRLSSYVPQKFLEENRDSQVLYARSLRREFLREDVLYEVFRSFGSVRRLVIMQAKLCALVQFLHLEDAVQAKEHLCAVKQVGRFFYSNYRSLSRRKSKREDRIFKYRSNQPASKVYNPITQFLHFSSLAPSRKEQFLSEVETLAPLEGYRFEGESKGLLKFPSVLDSMYVLGRLQGWLLGPQRVKLAFTRSKF